MSNDTELPTPPIPAAVVHWLEALFPDRCPPVGTPRDTMNAFAGRQEVIRKLRHELDKQMAAQRGEDTD